ncbi:MAG TPA: N-acetyltransferase [Thermoleophilia bacterium]|nr:N-acetyltransferase [Thermoleophilia bacterium]
MRIVTVAEDPELAELAWELTKDAMPEYNNHGDVLNVYWPRLTDEFGEFQFHLIDDAGDLVARARCLPIRWDGTVADLPAGIDGAMIRGFEEGGGNTLCALLISIPRSVRSRGVSRLAVRAMTEIARRNGLGSLIAPVRPNWKERYPLTPIDEYATWRRDDGLLFDPWMRVHERLGARILKPEPESLRITGTVAGWEEWVAMPFPASGDYVFPGGLAPVTIDRAADVGSYWEPNVWMQHPG